MSAIGGFSNVQAGSALIGSVERPNRPRGRLHRGRMGRYGARKETSMRGKLMFGAGVGLGYLLGTRAGRERFDQITAKAKRFWDSDTVQEAAGAMQAKAGQLYEGGKHMMSDQTGRMRERNNRKR